MAVAEWPPCSKALWKATYHEIFEECRNNPRGYRHVADPRNTLDVPQAERIAKWEYLWSQPGFAKWIANFHDVSITYSVEDSKFSPLIEKKEMFPLSSRLVRARY